MPPLNQNGWNKKNTLVEVDPALREQTPHHLLLPRAGCFHQSLVDLPRIKIFPCALRRRSVFFLATLGLRRK